jgi:hypothetical protein
MKQIEGLMAQDQIQMMNQDCVLKKEIPIIQR